MIGRGTQLILCPTSTLTYCVLKLVGAMKTTVLAKLLSNFTNKLLIIAGGNLLMFGNGIKSQGLILLFVYKTLRAGYRKRFYPSHFQTSRVSCLS